MNKLKELSEGATQKTEKPTEEPIKFKFTASIITLAAVGIILLIVAEITFIKDLPGHIATLIAHFGVAFIVAALVAFALEMPHNKEYIKKVLSDIVIKRDFLKTLDNAQLVTLRRDCDLARLGFPDEDTKGKFTEVEKSFYQYVAEEAWTSLITSHYRTDYTQSTIFSNNNCPNDFWIKKELTRYTLYRGIPTKNEKKENLKICRNVIFDIDHKLLQAQGSYPGNSNQCALTNEKCCFTECGEGCLFISTFQVTIGDIIYSLDLKNKILNPDKSGEGPIKVTITPQLSEGEVTMELNHEVIGDKFEVEIVQLGLVKKVKEMTSVKMNIPTRDAVFIFNFPEGVVTRTIYFGFREVDPFSNKDTNNVYARVPTWMFPGDGIAIAWWASPDKTGTSDRL